MKSLAIRLFVGAFGVLTLGACATDPARSDWQGGVFLPTNPTTDHPRYVVCNGDGCGFVDKDGKFTRMSDDERRSYRMGIRLAEQNRRFNEGERFPPPNPPENRDSDTPFQNASEARKPSPD